MPKYTGVIYIPFDIEHADNEEQAEEFINLVLDTFGQHDFNHLTFTWDNPDCNIVEVEDFSDIKQSVKEILSA